VRRGEAQSPADRDVEAATLPVGVECRRQRVDVERCVDPGGVGRPLPHVDDVFEKITEINEESGTAVLMVEQNARRALQEADRGVVLDLGEPRMQGTGAELLDSEEVQELYLGT
jgi:ABC-type lipopolysaccharide export system ATPase subunit